MTSLLKCTWKKSIDVTKKWIKYISYAIGGTIAFFLTGIGANVVVAMAYESVLTAATNIIKVIGVTFAGIFAVASIIPWWMYIIGVCIAAIPAYSFLWCLNRELTAEDRMVADDDIGFFGCALLSYFSTFAVSASLINGLTSGIFGTLVMSALLGFLGVCGMLLVLVRAPSYITGPVLEFPSAYLHYRKRMKEERK